MKKIISTTLLLAAGTALATAESVTYSSSLYSTEDGTSYDATTIIYSGRSASNITNDSTYTYSGSNAIYSADRANLSSMTFLMSSLYTKYTGTDTLYLTSFSIVTRDSALTDISDVTITISDSNGVVATSTGGSADSNVSVASVYGLATFSFNGTVALSTDTVYTVTFSGYSSTSGSATGFGVGAFKTSVSGGLGFGLNGSTLTSAGDSYTYNGNNNYQCVYSLTLSTTAVPEPSSFGLLAGLGALALVAARRRRRK